MFSAHGVLRMNAGRAVIIASTMPLWATIFSTLLLKERITSTRLLTLGFGLGGLALLIWPELEAVGTAPLGAAFMPGGGVYPRLNGGSRRRPQMNQTSDYGRQAPRTGRE